MLRRIFLRWGDSDYTLTVLAVVIGLVTALGAVGFSYLIELVRELYYVHLAGTLSSLGLYVWLLPLLPMSGGLMVGLITCYFAPEAEGHGVPEVMDAMARQEGRIRPRVAGAKAVASSLTIGSGGSAGTEGPIIQIGAALGSSLGQWLKMTSAELRVLIGCGTAAGIASIFNAPIAGVLFAVEVLLRDVSLRSFIPIIVASVASSTATQAMRGGQGPLFPVPFTPGSGSAIYMFSIQQIPNYALLGIVCGLIALLYVKLLYYTEDLFAKLPGHRVLRPVLGALLLGLAAVGSDALINRHATEASAGEAAATTAAHEVGPRHIHQPPILGNGYPVIGQSLDPNKYAANGVGTIGTWTVMTLAVLLIAKILATCLTLGSGGSGGVFAPSLFIGATAGGAFGILVQQTGWFTDVSPGAYALVGMATVVAASIHAPLTAGIMLFELTGDYEIIIPIMLAGVIGLAVARGFEPASIYTLKLLRRGIDLHKGQDISLLRHLFVRDAMRSDPVTVRPEAGVMQVVSKFIEHPGTTICVIDAESRLRGLIASEQSRAIMADVAAFKDILIARDIMREQGFPTVRPTDTLADVMRRLARYRGEVPVVENGKLVGVMWPEDVIDQYNTELFKRDMAASMATSIARSAREPVLATQDVSVAEIPVPYSFVGCSLGQLDVRNRFNVSILMIKQRSGEDEEMVNAVPSASYVFAEGDAMLVMGPDDCLRRLERGDIALA